MALKSLPRVASNVFIACTKCDRDGSYCKVIAHTSSTSAKTKCEICGKTKTLKLESAVGPKRAVSGKKSAPRVKSSEKQFELLLQEFGTTGTPYTIKGAYEKNAVIEHPKFGRGVVTASHKDKMDVLFRDGLRGLIQNRK